MIIERMKSTADQLRDRNVLVIKLQTTGTEPDDEILELCAIDARDPWLGGDRTRPPRPVFHARFRPGYKASWPEAERVNGISPAMVARESLLDDRRGELLALFARHDCLVSFNGGFDFGFLRRQIPFRAGIMVVDLMRDWTEHVSATDGRGTVCQRMPFFSQKDLFSHFGLRSGVSMMSDCLGLRHCFLQLIKLGCVHVRRPLLERRFNRLCELQLGEMQEVFQSEISKEEAAPYLTMDRDGENIIVRCGVKDPGHLLYQAEAPSATLTVSGLGSPADVRGRVARALELEESLPSGLRQLACQVLRGQRPVSEEAARQEPARQTRQADCAPSMRP